MIKTSYLRYLWYYVLVLAALALWIKIAMTNVDYVSQVYIVLFVITVFSNAPIIYGIIMGYKARNTVRKLGESPVKSDMVGIMSFALWTIIAGLISTSVFLFIDNVLLDKQVSKTTSEIIAVIKTR